LVASIGVDSQLETVILSVVSSEFWENLLELGEEDIVINGHWEKVADVKERVDHVLMEPNLLAEIVLNSWWLGNSSKRLVSVAVGVEQSVEVNLYKVLSLKIWGNRHRKVEGSFSSKNRNVESHW